MRRLVLLLCLLQAFIYINASKALHKPIQAVQPDGSVVTVIGYGDEDLNWYTTLDGVMVVHVGKAFYVAEINDNGELLATSQLAHNKDKRDAMEIAFISKQDKLKFFNTAESRANKLAMRRISLGTSIPSYFPHSGSPKAIVILIQYQDVHFSVSDPKTVFNEYLNSEESPLPSHGTGEENNFGSVKKYFSDMSKGSFTPQFDVYGPVTASMNMEKYDDTNYSALIQEACKSVDNELNFADYDADGDGYVDLVYVIYAGYGESNGAASETIWPKSGTISPITFDGKKVCRFGLNNELNFNETYSNGGAIKPQINGIGLFCHEFSHTMGLADIYPTTSKAYLNNQEMEYWDLMDGGEYVMNGYYPAPYTAWELEVMKWNSINELTTSETLSLEPVIDGGKAYKMVNPNDENEYFVMENIQKSGWARYMPGHGLLVYKVKWPSTEVKLSDHPNNTPGTPGMAVVPADGVVLSSYLSGSGLEYTDLEYYNSHKGDPFPGTSIVTSLNNTMNLPNFKWYSGVSEVNLALKNITETAGSISFDYISDFITGIYGITNNDEVGESRIYTIDGKYVGNDMSKLPKGMYIKNNKKIVIK